jgi:DHA1 family tetracycline resistance protein-like MFS transporter
MDRRPIILFFTIFIDLVGFGIFVPVVPIYARELNASEALVGDTGALFSLMMFIFTPFWGTLSDRYGRRPVIMAALALSAASYVMFAHATTLFVLIASRMLTGVGSGNITAAQAYITDITPPEGRAKAMGIIGAAFGLGFIFGPPLGSIVFDMWRHCSAWPTSWPYGSSCPNRSMNAPTPSCASDRWPVRSRV